MLGSPLRRACIVALALVGALHAAPAAADAGADARRFFEAAQRAFDEGRFVDAAHAFEDAFKLKPHPAPLINAGDAWEKAGEYALAARSFERVLALESADEQDKTDATDRLARLRPQLGVLVLVGEASLRVKVDEEEFHGGERPYLFPGAHKVTLVDVDGAKQRTVTVPAGGSASIELATLLPTPGAGEPRVEGAAHAPTGGAGAAVAPTGGGGGAWTWVAYGVGAVGLAGFTVFGLQANGAADRFDAHPNRDDYDAYGRHQLYANLGLGVGAAGIIAGTSLLILDLTRAPAAPRADAARRTRFELGVSRAGGFVGAAGSF